MRKLIISAIATLILCGCSVSVPFTRMKALPGSYELRNSEQVVRLTLNADGTYIETIHYKNGAMENVQSTWTWERLGVQVKNFLIPKGSVPESLFRSDGKEIARRTKQGTIQFDWSLDPWTTLSGKTMLYVNPDAGPAFEKQF